MFNAVEFVRRNGPPVFIQPRHVAAFEPYLPGGEQLTQTIIKTSDGEHYTVTDSPSTVAARLRKGE